jgi:hypothetical protein
MIQMTSRLKLLCAWQRARDEEIWHWSLESIAAHEADY